MVSDTRAPARAGAIKPLNAPQPVEVREESGVPVAVRIVPQVRNPRTWRARRRAPSPQPSPAEGRGSNAGAALRSDGVWVGVSDIEDVWKVSDEWWRGDEEEIERLYYSLMLESDQQVTLFQDLKRCKWYRQAD